MHRLPSKLSNQDRGASSYRPPVWQNYWLIAAGAWPNCVLIGAKPVPHRINKKAAVAGAKKTAARVAQEEGSPLRLGKPNSGLRHMFRIAEDCLFQPGFGEAPTNSSKLVAGELCVAHVSRVPRTAPPASTERLP